MNTVVLENITKRFGPLLAVDDVSFTVQPGEIFGLLGPNGAGKTTIIRMMLDILRPDSGHISIFDGPMAENKKDRIGYLPEERGLYADIKLWDTILYLASLKRIGRDDAAVAAESYLRRLDLWEHRQKKLSEMSRGMHQKAQFIVTVLHDPDLIIVDEPFSGLDPVNTELIRDIILSLRDQGKAIVMSTHQMHQVEAMCDRIVLIDRGHVVLRGEVKEVRQQFAGNSVEVSGSGPFADLPEVAYAELHNGRWHLALHEDVSPQALLRTLARRDDVMVEHFTVALPSLHEIFIRVVERTDDIRASISEPVAIEAVS